MQELHMTADVKICREMVMHQVKDRCSRLRSLLTLRRCVVSYSRQSEHRTWPWRPLCAQQTAAGCSTGGAP